jgi:hypothetical protein
MRLQPMRHAHVGDEPSKHRVTEIKCGQSFVVLGDYVHRSQMVPRPNELGNQESGLHIC